MQIAARAVRAGERLFESEADVIVGRGDPLHDIRAMAEVRLVMRSGTVTRNDEFD